MADLFEQVYHHVTGSETEIQNWQTLDGIKTVAFQSFGPDRWIENVYERSRMTGIECLAIILYEVDVSLFDMEPARLIVESWAVELRKAVSTGEIQARDPVTLLALEPLPDSWEWLLTMAEADKFIAARGLEWQFCEVALHLFNEFEQAIQNRRFPPWTRTAPATVTAPEQSPATPAPVVAESSEQRRARWLDWYGKGERGAVQRVHTRELLTNPKADRSFIGKEIGKAKQEKEKAKRGGFMFSQLVTDGKRRG